MSTRLSYLSAACMNMHEDMPHSYSLSLYLCRLLHRYPKDHLCFQNSLTTNAGHRWASEYFLPVCHTSKSIWIMILVWSCTRACQMYMWVVRGKWRLVGFAICYCEKKALTFELMAVLEPWVSCLAIMLPVVGVSSGSSRQLLCSWWKKNLPLAKIQLSLAISLGLPCGRTWRVGCSVQVFLSYLPHSSPFISFVP